VIAQFGVDDNYKFAHFQIQFKEKARFMHKEQPILLIVTGHTIEPVRSIFGNTDAHFAKAVGTSDILHTYAICDEWPKTPVPNLADFEGVIMTGSASMLGENQPWMQASKKLVERCLSDEIPFLGVCFGHQVLGAVCGAQIGPNPSGRANGSRLVQVEPFGCKSRTATSFSKIARSLKPLPRLLTTHAMLSKLVKQASASNSTRSGIWIYRRLILTHDKKSWASP
jgi:GMP synthase-like glutamine amidotransferase